MRLLLDEHFDYTISNELQRRGIDAIAITKERKHLVGQDDDVVLRDAAGDRRVVVTNNVRDYVRLIDEFGVRGETHFGVVFTDDETFPRSQAGVGLMVRALEALARGRPDDWLLDSCMYLTLA